MTRTIEEAKQETKVALKNTVHDTVLKMIEEYLNTYDEALFFDSVLQGYLETEDNDDSVLIILMNNKICNGNMVDEFIQECIDYQNESLVDVPCNKIFYLTTTMIEDLLIKDNEFQNVEYFTRSYAKSLAMFQERLVKHELTALTFDIVKDNEDDSDEEDSDENKEEEAVDVDATHALLLLTFRLRAIKN